jgi:glycosyltransferase involved in cell wall biosynthesis
MKRIKLIVEAFALLPDKKIIFCSTGPLKNWLIKQCEIYPNITYEGIVSEQRLAELIGNCKAGVVIPIDEDAGMVQIELMSAGKPLLAVAEGGLLETVIEGETGYFVPANPSVENIIEAIKKFDIPKNWKEKCQNQAKLFSETAFFEQLDKYIL